METLNDPGFWEWLRKKDSEKSQNEFEPVPLYISVVIPPKPEKQQKKEDQSSEYEIDYSVDDGVVYQF